MDRELRRRGVDDERARSMAFALLDDMLFARRDRAPHLLLGLAETASRAQVRDRYRLLMRVYHPDFAAGSSAWLNDRAARLNDAYRCLTASQDRHRKLRSAPPVHVPCARRSGAPRSRRRSSGRVRTLRALGTANAFRRRVLAALVLLGAAAVTYAFLDNRTWERWSPPSDLERAAKRSVR